MSLTQLNLPEPVVNTLRSFVDAAQLHLNSSLKSIVLYGSAAEGKLRATSDVNLIVVLKTFEAQGIDALREPFRTAHAAIDLAAMFLLEHEIPDAVDAFAVKFADVRHRHVVLFGSDPFATLAPSKSAELARVGQVLLNTVLRLRQGYVLRSLRDEQATRLVADAAGPLRTCAEALLEVQGRPELSPKEALLLVAHELKPNTWDSTLSNLSTARETGTLPPGVGATTLLALIDLSVAMREQATVLRERLA